MEKVTFTLDPIRTSSRFIHSLLHMLIALSLLVSCQQSQSRSPQSPKIVKLKLPSEPLSLDPRVGGDGKSQIVICALFERLMQLDPANTPVEALAEKVDISEDQKNYTFRLKKTTWSNGDPVTAHDFQYAWTSVLDPQFPTSFSYLFFVIKNARSAKLGNCPLDEVGIKALDDYTLHIELEHPTPYFLELITNPAYSPIHRKQAVDNPNWSSNAGEQFICNGPFKLDTWDHQSEIKLKKNEHYFTADKVQLEGITFSFIEDPHTALSLFEKGELDWIGDPFGEIPSEAVPSLIEKGTLRSQDTGSVYWLEFNTSHPIFRSVNMRQAFARALNRKEITHQLRQIGESPAFSILSNNLSLQSSPAFADGDIANARQYFEEGLKELNLTRDQLSPITLSYSTKSGEKSIEELIQQQWQKAFNIPIRLRGVEWNVYFHEFATHQFEVAGCVWTSYINDPIYNLEYLKYKDNGMNATLWEDPEYTRLLDQADIETDRDKRKQLLRKAEKILLDQMPIIPLFYPAYQWQQNPTLKNVMISNLGQIDFKWAYFETNEQRP